MILLNISAGTRWRKGRAETAVNETLNVIQMFTTTNTAPLLTFIFYLCLPSDNNSSNTHTRSFILIEIKATKGPIIWLSSNSTLYFMFNSCSGLKEPVQDVKFYW